MRLIKEPDYSTYTLKELLEVIDCIDKELYPHRVEKILSEIKLRKSGVAAKEKVEEEVESPFPEFEWPKKLAKEHWLIIIICSAFTTYALYFDYIPMRGVTIERLEQPALFYMFLVFFNAICVFILFVKEDT